MTLSYKTLPLEQVGLDLTKEVSTSGTLHSFIPSRNSILLAPEDGAQGLVIDIENLTSLLGTVRGQSNDLSAQFQTQVGPNAQRTLHLPYSGDWSFSVSLPPPFQCNRYHALVNYHHFLFFTGSNPSECVSYGQKTCKSSPQLLSLSVYSFIYRPHVRINMRKKYFTNNAISQ